MPNQDDTIQLLQRWHTGDKQALSELLRRDLPWIQTHVRHRMGEGLRQKAETMDFVQDAMVEVLRYGPRFELSNRAHFRALMARIVENVLRGKHHWFQAQRRAMARERPLPTDSVINLDPPEKAVSTPSMVVDRESKEALLRLALELLEPEDRDVLVLRQWKKLSFKEIAKELELSEDAARMRFNRTLPRLTEKMRQLKSGEIDALVGQPGESPDPDHS